MIKKLSPRFPQEFVLQLKQMLSVILLGALLCNLAHAATPSVSKPAKLEDVQKILRLAKLDSGKLYKLRNDLEMHNRNNPEAAIDIEVYLANATLDTINERMAPIYASHLSQDYADKLLKELPTLGGKARARLLETQLVQGQYAAQAQEKTLAPNERTAMIAFDRSTTFASLSNAHIKSIAEVGNMLNNWLDGQVDVRIQQARKMFADLIDSEIAAEKSEIEANDIAFPQRLPRTGLRYVDKEIILEFDHLRKSTQLSRRFMKEFKATNIDNALDRENLLSMEKIAASKLSLHTAEYLFNEHLKETEKLQAAYQKNFSNIPMTEARRQRYKENSKIESDKKHALEVKYVEQMRISFDLRKRILALFEENLGAVSLQDGKMLFDSEEALTKFNALYDELEQVARTMDSLLDKDYDRRTHLALKLRKK